MLVYTYWNGVRLWKIAEDYLNRVSGMSTDYNGQAVGYPPAYVSSIVAR